MMSFYFWIRLLDRSDMTLETPLIFHCFDQSFDDSRRGHDLVTMAGHLDLLGPKIMVPKPQNQYTASYVIYTYEQCNESTTPPNGG